MTVDPREVPDFRAPFEVVTPGEEGEENTPSNPRDLGAARAVTTFEDPTDTEAEGVTVQRMLDTLASLPRDAVLYPGTQSWEVRVDQGGTLLAVVETAPLALRFIYAEGEQTPGVTI